MGMWIASMWSMRALRSTELTLKMRLGAARAASAWRITKIAALNDGTGGTDGTRKVFFAADLVLTRNYTAILFGSGDREKPLNGTTNDRFFLVKDSRVRQRRAYITGHPDY